MADSIARLAPHDSTNVQAGLNLGVRLADRLRRERPEALNYIILMSDGVANVDATDPFAILEATAAPRGSNPLRLITVGVGIANYNDLLLEQLAQHGNGWYRYLFDVAQAQATFQRENWLALSSPIADQTRAQVVWNPAAVRTWRIVGYENRVTSAEAFTQDREEFAEVYAGAATTVFYELELHDDFRDQGGLGQVELRWVGPESGRAWSQSSDLVSNGEVVQLQDHPLLAFGAVVALTADRYSALRDGSAAGPRDMPGSCGACGSGRWTCRTTWVIWLHSRTSPTCKNRCCCTCPAYRRTARDTVGRRKTTVQGHASAPLRALHPLSKCWRGGRGVRSAPPAAPRRKPTLVRLRLPSGRLLCCAQSAAGAIRMASYSRRSRSRRRAAGKGDAVRGYTLRDRKGRIKYVGVSNDPRRRAAEHKRDGKHGKLKVETRSMPRSFARYWEKRKLAHHRKTHRGRNPVHNKTRSGGWKS